MSLPSFSVRHSIFGNMLTLFVLIGGLVMVVSLQRDTFPEIELDLMVISTLYPNASPEEVEELITNPIEEELKEVEDIEEYTSSSVEGISVITVEIDSEAKYKERVVNEVQQAVDRVVDLPEEAEDPEVKSVVERGPIIRLVLAGEVSEGVLRDFGDYMKERLDRVAGVSTIVQDGWRDEEFWVEVDLGRLEEWELSLPEVAEALRRQNVNRPGGKMPSGSDEMVLRTLGQFHSAEEIGEVVVRSNSDGNAVRVRDIATVRRTYEEDREFLKLNGSRAVILGPKKKRSGDTITITDAIKEVVDAERERAPEGLRMELIDDESFYVKRRLRILSSNGTIGFIGVVTILFLFLNFRTAIITGIGIPFAFLGALMLMSLFGITVNLITMFGLIIVLGMVVDDAIIVGENIYRHVEDGMDPRTAAIQGTEEVMYPVVSTVLTTIAAFAPLVFAPDVMGQVLRWFPIVVAITLVASLFEVLIIMPCHAADLIKPMKPKARRNGSPSSHRIMHWMLRTYERHIKIALKGRYFFLPIVFVIFVLLMGFARKNMRVDIFPADLIDVFTVRVAAPQGTPLEQSEVLIDEIDRRIHELPESELENVVSVVGGHMSPEGGFSARGTHYSSAFVYLTPQEGRERRTQTIIDELRERTADVPGIEKIEFEMIEPGPPTGKPLEVKIRGDAFETLLEISGEIQAFLGSVEGVYDIQDDYEPGKEELHIRVDPGEAARLGLDMALVAETVYAAFQGAESTIVREGDEEIIVRVMLNETFRDDPGSLEELSVRNRAGRLIPLSRVATFERTTGLPAVYHYDGDRVITVSAFFAEGVDSVAVNRDLEKAFRDLPQRYPGYDLIRGGEWKETRKLMIFMVKAFGMALLMIYLILCVQFNSMVQPFVVMAAIPLGLTGVLIALILHAQPLSIMAAMGIVGMTGVVVNDAIVLVKFINDQRRNHDMDTFEAIVLAGRRRFRPILLTSVTTIAGLVPVIYGWGGYEPFVAPAAIALAYGLLFATFLTLMVVPSVYMVFFDVKRLLTRIRGSS